MGRRGEGAAVPEGRAFGKRRPKPVMKRKDEEEKGGGGCKERAECEETGLGSAVREMDGCAGGRGEAARCAARRVCRGAAERGPKAQR